MKYRDALLRAVAAWNSNSIEDEWLFEKFRGEIIGSETLIYDPATNTFLVRGGDGASKTMFRPADGIEYWNKQ